MAILNDLKIKTKLIVGFSVLAFIVICVGTIGYNGITKVSEVANMILEEQIPITNYSMELAISFTTTRKILADYLAHKKNLNEIEDKYHEEVELFHMVYTLKDDLALSVENREQVELIGATIHEYEEIAKEIMDIHIKIIINEKEPTVLMKKMDALVDNLVEKAQEAEFSLEEYEIISKLIMAANDYINTEADSDAAAFKKLDLEIRRHNKFPEIESDYNLVHFFGKKTINSVNKNIEYRANLYEKTKIVDKIGSEMERIVTNLNEQANINMSEAIKTANSAQESSTRLQIIFTLGSVCLAILLGVTIPRSISKPISMLQAGMEKLAKGDLNLDLDIHSKNEIGNLAKSTMIMIRSLKEMAEGARKIAQGDTSIDFKPRSDSDIMGNAMKTMMESLKEVAGVAEKIARGDTSVNSKPRSDKDIMGNAMKMMVESLKEMAEGAEKIAKGDLSVNFISRSDQDILGNALIDMTENLRAVTTENEKQDWLKTGQSGLNKVMRGDQDISDLGRNIVSYLVSHLNSQIGAIYTTNQNDDILKLAGSYAYTKRKNLSNKFNFGEGMVGQAALEKHNILLSNVPDDYIKVNSGLGEAAPNHLLVVPFLHEEQVQGVIELGAFDKFTDIQQDFLKLVTGPIAIAFNSALSRVQTKDLLEKTQAQAEELQSQQEELRVSNEELEEQAKSLKESEAKLQAQQEELQQTNEELEERSDALESQKNNIEKKNIELEKAKEIIQEKAKELELTSKYKSEFLANMSHELRTPLNSLFILSKFLADNKESNLTQKQVEFASTIHASGGDLLSLINDILDLSKVESGKMVRNIENVQLNELASNIKRTFMPMVQQKDLSLDIDIGQGLPDIIQTDIQRVNQVIKNLLSNAIKFTHQGGITVKIYRPHKDNILSLNSLKHEEAIAISISDTGIGIPKEKQKLIFEAFQQADGSTNRRYGGTGLGLSISRELAKFLGGEIQMRSKEGKGSTFILFLPETISNEQKSEPKETSEKNIPTGPVDQPTETDHADLQPQTGPPTGLETIRDDRREIQLDDKTILIVEDDPNFAKILFGLVHEKGYKCLVAGDGETGLQFADYYEPIAIVNGG